MSSTVPGAGPDRAGPDRAGPDRAGPDGGDSRTVDSEASDPGSRGFESGDSPASDQRTFEEKRYDQLTSAPEAIESDADQRIDVTTMEDGTTRIDIRKDAPIQP